MNNDFELIKVKHGVLVVDERDCVLKEEVDEWFILKCGISITCVNLVFFNLRYLMIWEY